MADVIDYLPVTIEERATLRSFGANGPLALLSLRKAATRAFDEQFHPGRAEIIAAELRKFLTDRELQALNQPLRQGGRLGARLK